MVRGDEKTPVVVTLAPAGKVSGRLLDADGKSLQGVEVSINPTGVFGRGLYRDAPVGKPVRTDKEGRFRLEDAVPNLPFWLYMQRQRTLFDSEPSIGERQLKPGESLDLGDVRVKPDP